MYSVTLRDTQYPELKYRQDDHSLWRIYDAETECAVGEQYLTRGELLRDLDRFAINFGCQAEVRK